MPVVLSLGQWLNSYKTIMKFTGTPNFSLNRDGKKMTADENGMMEAGTEYTALLAAYGFKPTGETQEVAKEAEVIVEEPKVEEKAEVKSEPIPKKEKT